MRYPRIDYITQSREFIDAFRGYNHNLRISDGEFYDMSNLTSDYFPLLSPREPRGVYVTPESSSGCNGIIAKDDFCYVDGASIFVGETEIDLALEDSYKSLISMGAYIIILPDKKYVNTQDLTDYGDIEAEFTTSGTVTFTLCKITGDPYTVTYTQDSEPKNPQNEQYWIDTSQTPHSLKQYSSSSGMWVSIATTYVKIEATGIGAQFKAYDSVTISGVKSEELSDLNNNMLIYDCGDDCIIVVGILDKVTTQTDPITVKLGMPVMDFVIESGNRLWGCRFGSADDGSMVNEIYASKLGDFRNWSCYQGISTDSYRASVGTDGAFTGAVSHMGYPIFFKEGCMHKVYGSMPSNYQIQTTACRGVQKGSDRSLAIVNEVLYYKSRFGICAYDGSLPAEVSSALGEVAYFNAVGGAHGNKYYISMSDADDNYYLFIYDTMRGMWHKEDLTHAIEFASWRNEMYFVDADSGKIKTIFGGGTADETRVKWSCETGLLGLSSPDRKYISRLNIRISLDTTSSAFFYIQYDSSSSWQHIASLRGSKTRSLSVAIRPRRCDHFRIRIEGEGDMKIYSITKTMSEGSDI